MSLTRVLAYMYPQGFTAHSNVIVKVNPVVPKKSQFWPQK